MEWLMLLMAGFVPAFAWQYWRRKRAESKVPTRYQELQTLRLMMNGSKGLSELEEHLLRTAVERLLLDYPEDKIARLLDRILALWDVKTKSGAERVVRVLQFIHLKSVY